MLEILRNEHAAKYLQLDKIIHNYVNYLSLAVTNYDPINRAYYLLFRLF